MTRIALNIIALFALSACAVEPEANPDPIQDFRLGYAVVQSRDVLKGPFSREATQDELNTALADRIEAQLAPYDGDGLYHIGIAIGAYVLAQPGIPVIYAPKSTLMFEVTVFDNATQQKLNEKPRRIIAFEGLQNTVPVLGSGLVRSKEEQLDNLVDDAARQLQNWLRGNADWFVHDPANPRVAFDRTAGRQSVAEAIAAQPPLETAPSN